MPQVLTARRAELEGLGAKHAQLELLDRATVWMEVDATDKKACFFFNFSAHLRDASASA